MSRPRPEFRCPQCQATYAPGTVHTCAAAPADPPSVRAAEGAASAQSEQSRTPPLGTTPESGTARADQATLPVPVAEAGADPLLGQVIDQRYQILEPVGHGGMGIVFKARHVALGSTIAVKILLRPRSDRDRDDMLREARIASKARHPHIVQVMDVGLLADGRPYLVMEFLEGQTVGQLLLQGPIALLRACRLTSQVARGMQAIHDKGIVHRDLKPDNIFLLPHNGKADFVKIVDFGIAKDLGSSVDLNPLERAATGGTLGQVLAKNAALVTQHRAAEGLIGTPLYMAPEQVRGLKLDGRCDQYALGCMLYQMLTGRPPFLTENALETMFLRLVKPPLSPRMAAPERGISAGLEAIVMRCLAIDPAQRFATMDELAEQLELEAEQLGIKLGTRRSMSSLGGQHQLTAGQPAAARWLRLRKLVLAGGVVVLAVMASAGYLLHERSAHVSTAELRRLEQRAVQVLVTATSATTGESADKTRALAGLAETHDVKLRPTVEEVLRSPSEEVQAQAAATLGALGATASVVRLAELYRSAPQPRVRLSAARALEQLGDTRGTGYLLEALGQSDDETRLRAALLLCEHTDAKAVAFLQTLVQAGTLPPQLLLNSLLCLARAGNEPAQQRLAALVGGGGSRDLQLGAASRLLQLGDARGRVLLKEVASHRGPQQLLAAQILAAAAEPGIDATFRAVYTSRDASPEALLLAVEGLGLSGQLADLSLLEPRLGEQTPSKLRLAAASAIVQIAYRDSTLLTETTADWTRAAADDSSATTRQAAATVLGDSLAADALTQLAHLMKDKESRVRQSGAHALGRRSERDALQILGDTLADSEAEVRREALRSLGKIAKTLSAADRSAVLNLVSTWLRQLIQTGSQTEQVLARGVLLLLGDSGQAGPLRQLAEQAPEDVRALVAEQLATSPQELVHFLTDHALTVRLTAARLFAAQGDRRGLAVLNEGLAQGGTVAQLASGALGRLGGPVQLTEEAEKLLGRGTSEERLMVVKAWAILPLDRAVPLLGRAACNGESQVRMQVVEVLSDLLRNRTAAASAEALGLLRLLIRDGDAAVQARAAFVLARALAESTANKPAAATKSATSPRTNPAAAGAAAGTEKQPEPTTPTQAQPENPTPQKEDPNSQKEGRGAILISNPRALLFQLDQRAWQRTDGRAVALDAGTHRVSSLSGTQTVELSANQTLTVEFAESAAEEAERKAQEALSAQDYRKAQKLFTRARAACSKVSGVNAGCALLGFDIAAKLGQVYEAQARFSEAMTEYQAASLLAPQVRGQKDGKSLVQAGITRLAGRLGRVVMAKTLHGKCQQQTLWLPTGTHTLVVAGGSKTIKVTAGTTVQVGTCS